MSEAQKAFYGESDTTSGIDPIVSQIFQALAQFDAPDSYKRQALWCAFKFMQGAEEVSQRLSSDILCIPLNEERN